MNEKLAERYRQIAYAPLTHVHTHPGHLGAVARLYGLAPAEPRTARVLELATGRGSNLNWIAKTLPEAQCLGVDLVSEGIEAARARAAEQGLINVEFGAGDLLETDFGDQQFDYLIAHGFMSWAPEPVQQRILEVCRDHLAPDGVALVSYSAMPGSAVRDSLRRLFLLEMQEAGERASPQQPISADEQMAAIERVIDFFESSLPTVDTMPHAAELLHNLQVLRKKTREVLLHDEVDVFYEPLYLLQFSQWAFETGLAYVADTDLRLDWLALLPESVQQAIAAQQMPRLKALQYADYLRNTSFRNSLVCHADQASRVRAKPDFGALADLYIRSLLVPETEVSAFDTSLARFRLAGQPLVAGTPTDGVIETTNPLLKTVLCELANRRDQPTRFGDLWQLATSRQAEVAAGELEAVAHFVLQSVSLGRMKLTLGMSG